MVKVKNKGSQSEFLILDGHSLAYRAFFALPVELKTSKGLYTNAVLGFVNMLLRLLRERNPGYLVVAFDHSAPTFRHTRYPLYKATREKTPGEMAEQLPLLQAVLQAFNISICDLEGYEADDLIGTLAGRGEEAGLQPLVVTADADAYQLLSAKVKILITRKGISTIEEYSRQKLMDDYGLKPEQWIDFKALKGDPSDNIPGVPGIGEKRALQLLKTYGSLAAVLREAGKIKGKVGESLLAYEEQALLGRELVTICKSAPLRLKPEDCRRRQPDWEGVYALFSQLEFKTLIEKTPELAALREKKTAGEIKDGSEGVQQFSIWSEDPSSVLLPDRDGNKDKFLRQKGGHFPPEYALYSPVKLTEGNLKEFADLLKDGEQLTVLAVNSLARGGAASPYRLLFALEDSIYYTELEQETTIYSEIKGLLQNFLENELKTLLTHDYKILFKLFLEKEISPAPLVFDTMLAAYLLEPDQPSYHLALLLKHYLGVSVPEPKEKTASKDREKEMLIFASLLARQMPPLQKVLLDNLKSKQLMELYSDLELPLVRVLAKMELRGIRVKECVLHQLATETEEKMLILEEEIYNLAGERVNLNSPKQLGILLFDKLKLPAAKKGKTGYSTDARVLEELAKQHPVAAKLLEYRVVSRLKNTYLEGLPPLINAVTGRIHTTFNQAVTATGRLSSKDPNLQNIPIKMEEGRRMRQAFLPAGDHDLLLAADYSQIELRILAHLSADDGLLDAFRHDQDIHMRTAAEVFNLPLEEVTPLMRSRAKAVNFGIVYGISDYGLAQDLKISRAEARSYIENYFARYPGVKAYADYCIQQAREKGYVTTVMNRRRYLPDINHPHFARRSFAERMARNSPIQGSAADIIKAAMIAIDEELEKRNLKVAMLLQVHDELIFELPPAEMEETALLVKEIMENVYPLAIPLKVALKAGRNWYHLYPVE